MSTPTPNRPPPPQPGSTAHRLAQFFMGMADKGAHPPESIARSAQRMAEAIQVGIDYEVGKARIEQVARMFKYRQALEAIRDGKHGGLAVTVAENALKE